MHVAVPGVHNDARLLSAKSRSSCSSVIDGRIRIHIAECSDSLKIANVTDA